MNVGRIYLYEDKTGFNKKLNGRLVVDAEPHVMSRVRSLFNNSANPYDGGGKFTHKPLCLPDTLTICRDLTWLLARYPMEIEPELMAQIESRSNEYDTILASVVSADQDKSLNFSPEAHALAVELREHQITFRNMALKMKKMLLADKMGLGKTISALSLLAEPSCRPALIVVPVSIATQWEGQVERVFPGMKTHIIKGFKNYPLPDVDVVITTYNRLNPWQDTLIAPGVNFKTIIIDEIQEIRHTGTKKREMCKLLSDKATFSIGLSGTPIYNMGQEIWSVLDAVKDGCLGSEGDFLTEWCTWGKVNEPATLNKFLKQQGLMLRRVRKDLNLPEDGCTKEIITLDADLDTLKAEENTFKTLALSILSGKVGMDSDAAHEFNWRLRQATGIAKARPVAEFVRMIVEGGEKVILTGWHRQVYDIWMKELKDFKPVMFTGSETAAQKAKAVKEFVEGDAKVFIISHRSGAGLDGLQRACHVVVHGELDWSPHVMDQLNARADRDGQTEHVMAYYVTINDGSDPVIMSIINVKRSQHDGVVEGKDGEADILDDADQQLGNERMRSMARKYLESIGEEIPVVIEETGLLKDVADSLRLLKLPANNEDEMQRAIWAALPGMLPDAKVEREFKISARSRLDFLVTQGNEKIVVECKVNATKRTEVYKQVRRYTEEAGVTAVILIAPWHGISSFIVDQTPVIVVDSSIASI